MGVGVEECTVCKEYDVCAVYTYVCMFVRTYVRMYICTYVRMSRNNFHKSTYFRRS